MSVRERDKRKRFEHKKLAGTLSVPDISTEERVYSRSLKIRLGVMECLARLAKKQDAFGQPVWDSFEDLGGYCANFVFNSGWDKKPASIVTCVRWCKQFFLVNGLFELIPMGAGSFSIRFRREDSQKLISTMLRAYKRKRSKPPKEVNRSADFCIKYTKRDEPAL